MFGAKTKNGFKQEMIESDLLSYTATILTLPTIFENSVPTFKDTYSFDEVRNVSIVAALATRSCVNQNNLQSVQNLLHMPFQTISIRNLPSIPGDLDWIIITNLSSDYEYKYENTLARELIHNIQKIPRCVSRYNCGKNGKKFTHEFEKDSIITIDAFREAMDKIPYSRHKKNHILEIPHNSILVYGEVETFEKMRNISGNPRTLKDYIESEWKPFYQAVKSGPMKIEPFITELTKEIPSSIKYFK